MWKLRSVLELAPEPKFAASMTLSPTAEAAWQEHRLTLPLADFPAEIFDPQIDEFLDLDGSLDRQKDSQEQKDEGSSVVDNEAYVGIDEASKIRKSTTML